MDVRGSTIPARDEHVARDVRLADWRQVGLDLVRRATTGRAEVGVALVDGPVDVAHPELASATVRALGGSGTRSDADPSHGTAVARLLVGADVGVCPGCTLWVRPLFADVGTRPQATPEALATAIHEVVAVPGVRVLNLSLGAAPAPSRAAEALSRALDEAGRRGIIVVVAAGNGGSVGSSTLTGHPAAIPVGACDATGRPAAYSNLGATIGRRGLAAPGRAPPPLAGASGTSFAAPLVAGAAALLASTFPGLSAAALRDALVRTARGSRGTVVPPVLDAGAAHAFLLTRSAKTRGAIVRPS